MHGFDLVAKRRAYRARGNRHISDIGFGCTPGVASSQLWGVHRQRKPSLGFESSLGKVGVRIDGSPGSQPADMNSEDLIAEPMD